MKKKIKIHHSAVAISIVLLALPLSLTSCSPSSPADQLLSILDSQSSDEKEKDDENESKKETEETSELPTDETEETNELPTYASDREESEPELPSADPDSDHSVQNRLILGGLLRNIYDSPYLYVKLISDANGWTNPSDIETCQFAFADINQDGKEELLVSFTCSYVAGIYTGIWTVDEEQMTAVSACQLSADAEYYRNGMVKEFASHNQSYGKVVYPYEILHFRSGETEYDWIGSGWCAEAALDAAHTEYSEAADTDHDGVIYFLVTNDEETLPLTKAEYQNRHDSLFPEDQKIEINWTPLDIRHINEALADETTGSKKSGRTREIVLSYEERNALDGLLHSLTLTNSAYIAKPAADWSDEAILSALYGMLYRNSYLSQFKGITGNPSPDYWRYSYSVETINHLSESIFGHVLDQENCKSGDLGIVYEDGNYLLSPADGESPGMYIDSVYETEGKIIAEGVSLYHYGTSDFYAGRFQAELKRSHDSPYGFSLIALSPLPERSGLSSLQASASSVLNNQQGNSYQPSCAVDGLKTTAWVEGVTGDGIGEWIEIARTDGKDLEFSALEIYTGYQKDQETLKKNGRASKIRAESADGTILGEWYLGGYNSASVCHIDHIVQTKSVRIIIEESITGANYEDTCISEIVLH